MPTESAYENVPAGVPLALTLEEAAQRVGMKTAYFRTTMSKLNAGGRDLRTPPKAGERARRYDLDKLDAWKAEGCPVPKDAPGVPKAKPGAREVTATAVRKGSHWLVELPEINQGTQADNLRSAHRISHALAVEKLGLAPDELTVNLRVTLPDDAAEKWERAKAREREAREASADASALSRQVVQGLRSQGLTLQDISELLGLSPQRVHQLDQDAR